MCGQVSDGAAVELCRRSKTSESGSNEFIEATLMKAIFLQENVRRDSLRAVARARRWPPLPVCCRWPACAMALQDAGKAGSLENQPKNRLHPDHLRQPVDCGSPTWLLPAAGPECRSDQNAWPIRDKMRSTRNTTRPIFVAHALAIRWACSNATPMNVATIQNINGQAITMALKHRTTMTRSLKGFRSIPFEYKACTTSFFAALLPGRSGLNPDTDVQLVVLPAEMVANLRAGNIDGFG
jgi:nitrate/nitrite transport system substrate-binding protein